MPTLNSAVPILASLDIPKAKSAPRLALRESDSLSKHSVIPTSDTVDLHPYEPRSALEICIGTPTAPPYSHE
jgi:hypothetical protein